MCFVNNKLYSNCWLQYNLNGDINSSKLYCSLKIQSTLLYESIKRLQNKKQDLLLIRWVCVISSIMNEEQASENATSRFNSSLIRQQPNARIISYEIEKKFLLTKQGGLCNKCIHINCYFSPDLYCCIKHNLTNYKDFFNRLQDRWPQNRSPGFIEVVGIKQGHEVVTLGETPFYCVWPTHITD